jgi:hypothetical protein
MARHKGRVQDPDQAGPPDLARNSPDATQKGEHSNRYHPRAHRQVPSSPRLEQSHSTRDLPPFLVIVCEGQTEEKLLKDLRGRWRIAAVTVKIVAEGAAPSSVVKKAIELRDEHRGRYRDTPVEVWVVFDRDEHPCWSRALDQARAHKFKLAVSNPCVELWGLLLHRNHSAYIERHVAQRLLSTLHAAYHHEKNPYFNADLVEENLDAAVRREAVLRRRAEDAGDILQNPMTMLSELIETLRRRRG